MNLKSLTTPQRTAVYRWLSDLEGSTKEQIEAALRSEPDPVVRDAVRDLFARKGPPTNFDPFEEIPLRLADYDIGEQIGSGGMGVVHRARHRSTHKEVAIKFLQAYLRLAPHEQARFRTEATQSFSLRHENIVHTHSVGEENGVPFIAMDLIEGQTLAEIIKAAAERRRPRDPVRLELPGDDWPQEHAARVAWLLAKIADALQSAHDAKIVHLDVKPSNILIDRNGRPLLSDFGVAQDLARVVSLELPAGTPFYMSPEQAQARRVKIDHRADVYSLGVVGYEMLTLVRPFDGSTKVAVFNAILRGDAQAIRALNPTVPRALETIIEKAMRREPELRYRSAAEFAADLRRFLEGKEPLAKPPTFAEITLHRLRRQRIPLALAAGLLLSVSLTLLFAGWFARNAQATLRVTTESGESAIVYLARLDPARQGIADPPLRLGLAPLTVEIADGCYQLAFESEDGTRTAEVPFFSVTRRNDVEVALPRLCSPEEVASGMIVVPGGDLINYLGTLRVDPFLIDRFEVTNRQYREFVTATGWRTPELWRYAERVSPGAVFEACFLDLPVAGVSQKDAESYARWSGKRLPTVNEWLYAASRDLTAAQFVWGAERGDGAPRANVATEIGRSQPVPGASAEQQLEIDVRNYLNWARPGGSFPQDRSWCGAYDLEGNLREWLATPTLSGAEIDPESPTCGGSSFNTGLRMLEEIGAPGEPYEAKENATGFRCAKSLPTRSRVRSS